MNYIISIRKQKNDYEKGKKHVETKNMNLYKIKFHYIQNVKKKPLGN